MSPLRPHARVSHPAPATVAMRRVATPCFADGENGSSQPANAADRLVPAAEPAITHERDISALLPRQLGWADTRPRGCCCTHCRARWSTRSTICSGGPKTFEGRHIRLAAGLSVSSAPIRWS